MLTLKNIYRYITLAHLMVLLGVCVACNEEMEYIPAAKQTIPMARVAIIENDARIETVRILIFDEKGDLVSNSGKIEVDDTNISDNILTISSEKIEARVSKNHVYVILNEENVILDGVTGSLTTNLDAIEKKGDMEILRSKPIKYEEIIAVEEGTEPAFLMCVYDEVDVTSSSTLLDITGLDTNDYGFSMRRTMAKVVLESVIGGVRPNGEIVGTSDNWFTLENKTYTGSASNKDLIATSAIHILGLELVNIPTHYSWKQEKELEDYPKYNGSYKTEPLTLAAYDEEEYYTRTWPGNITVSGKVPFTRVDKISDIWKIEGGSGGKAYTTVDPDAEDQDPAEYYIFTKNNNGYKTNVHNEKLTDLSNDKYDKSIYNYDHYSIENSNIKLWKTEDETIELEDAPNNQVYTLNSGNFTTWFKDTYNKDFGLSIAGTPVAGAPQADAVTITPAVWTLNFNNLSYYIPENIPQNSDNYTKLRITASIAIPTAVLDPVKVQEAIKALTDKGETGDLVQDETIIEYTDDNILKYMWAKGELVPHKNDPNIYALKYTGLSRIFAGEVTVGESTGQYDAITGMMATKVTIEIPLNNDLDNTDGTVDVNSNHNIYRGHEYKVQLFVTKSNNEWNNNQVNPTSRTINIGGEELTITGKVTASPIK